MLEGLRFDRQRLAAAASDQFLGATDVADLLVRRGVPFREAHGIVAGLVRDALERGKALSELDEADLASHSDLLDAEYYEVLRPERWLESKKSEGGTALERIREQLQHARGRLG
jgi:argininosuccinate lyase